MKPARALFIKDIVIEMRTKESVLSMMMFGLLVLVVFYFAFVPAGSERALIAPGTLWVALSFAGIIGLNRSLTMELDNDCLQGLLLAPLSRGDLYLAKVASNFAFMLMSELVILPLFVVFNNLSFDLRFLYITGVSILGAIGFTAIGTILSMISSNTRMRDVMLPILQIPLTLPVILSAVEATSMILDDSYQGISAWLSLLGGFSIVYLIASYLVFEYVVEE
jgi:heme exporter protein B